MSRAPQSLTQRIPWSRLAQPAFDASLFGLFFGALLCLAAVRFLPLAVLMLVGGTVLLLLRHQLEGRPRLYWHNLDTTVVVLFLYLVGLVFLSEIPGLSWRSTALYLCGLWGFLIGRLYFYRRIFAFTVGMALALGVCLAVATTLQDSAEAASALLRAERLGQVWRAVLVFFPLLLGGAMMIMPKRPHNFWILVWTVAVASVAFLYFSINLASMVQFGSDQESVERKHAIQETVRTYVSVWSNYRYFGTGLGTAARLFESFRISPLVPTAYPLSGLLVMLVETGAVGLLLWIYLAVRIPLHVARRWKLFPHRALRASVVVYFTLALVWLLVPALEPALIAPFGWVVGWTFLGALLGLVMIRDPQRIFAWQAEELEQRNISKPNVSKPTTPRGRRPMAELAEHAGWSSLIIGVLLLGGFSLVPNLALWVAPPPPRGETKAQSTADTQQLAKAVQLFPLDAGLRARLGESYLARVVVPMDLPKYMTEIEDAFRKAIQYDPYNPRYYEQLAFLYNDTNRTAQAVAVLNEGVRNVPNYLVLRLLLVRELERSGNYALAAFHVQRIVTRIAPEQKELYLRLAELMVRQNQLVEAMRYYQIARQVVAPTAESDLRLRRLREKLGSVPPR